MYDKDFTLIPVKSNSVYFERVVYVHVNIYKTGNKEVKIQPSPCLDNATVTKKTHKKDI